MVTALSNLCKALWPILVSYHLTALWHEHASQFVETATEASEEGNKEGNEECEDSIRSPELVRQWHGYVASKLGLNRGRVWMDVVSRVRPILSAIAANAKELNFEEIVATLNIVNRWAD